MYCISCDRPTTDTFVDEAGETLCDNCASVSEGPVYYVDGTPVVEDVV